MRALSLFITLASAHWMMLAGRDVSVSLGSVPAYLWQDAAVAMLFGLFAHVARRPGIVWSVYGLIVGYAAINVVVARVLPSALTLPMLRAARGTLSASIAEYVTAANLAVLFAVAAIGTAVPVAMRRLRWSVGPRLLAGLAVAVIAIGLVAQVRIDSGGWHRNAFGVLLPSRISVPAAAAPTGNRRLSPFETVGDGTSLAAYRGAARGRNIVLIILESAGAQYLGLYGADRDPMPNLSALAAQGAFFEFAFSAYPESIKGFFAVLCARHPGLRVSAEVHALAECRSLARALSDAGYRTGLFHSGRFDYLGMRGIVEDRGFDMLADAGTIGGRVDSSFGIDEASTVDAMLAWIDGGASADPFFLTYLPIAGHHPYATTSPGPFDPVDDRSRYLNAIHEADRGLGALVAGIEERSLGRETLYVVFGDHGEAFGQHADNIGHSFYLYQENVWVPYLIALPGLIESTIRVPQPISVVDTAPTILDLVGVPIPNGLEGISVLEGDRRIAFFGTDYAQVRLGLVDGCRKFLYDADAGRSELFDICADADEGNDLSGVERRRVDEYRARLLSWASATSGDLRAEAAR